MFMLTNRKQTCDSHIHLATVYRNDTDNIGNNLQTKVIINWRTFTNYNYAWITDLTRLVWIIKERTSGMRILEWGFLSLFLWNMEPFLNFSMN